MQLQYLRHMEKYKKVKEKQEIEYINFNME